MFLFFGTTPSPPSRPHLYSPMKSCPPTGVLSPRKRFRISLRHTLITAARTGQPPPVLWLYTLSEISNIFCPSTHLCPCPRSSLRMRPRWPSRSARSAMSAYSSVCASSMDRCNTFHSRMSLPRTLYLFVIFLPPFPRSLFYSSYIHLRKVSSMPFSPPTPDQWRDACYASFCARSVLPHAVLCCHL